MKQQLDPELPETLEERTFELYAYAKHTVYRLQRDPRCKPHVLALAARAERILFKVFEGIRMQEALK